MKKFLAFLSALAVFSSPALAYQPPAGASGAIQYNLNNYFTGLLLGDNTLLGSVTSGTPRAITLGSGLSMNGSGVLSSSGSGGTVTSLSVVSANGLAGTVATSTTTPAITLSTTITGLLKGNGTAISGAVSGADYAPATSGTSILKALSGGFTNAVSGTDYAPATSGSSILYGNGSGGFSNVTVGNGLLFQAGTLIQAAPSIFSCGGTDDTSLVTSALANGLNSVLLGTCKINPISISGSTVTLDMAGGAVLEPAGSSDIDIMITFTNSNVTLKTVTMNGLGLAQQGIKFINGTVPSPNSNITLSNFGYPIDVSTGGVIGLNFTDPTSIQLGSVIATGFQSVGNGTCDTSSALIGSIRGLYFLGTGYADIKYFYWGGGSVSGDNGVQVDAFHATTSTVGGEIHNLVERYNQNTRRVGKFQSGDWVIDNMDVRPGSDFSPVSGGTQVGLYNLNAIDWAANTAGTLTVNSGYIDCSAFPACIGASLGTARVHIGQDVTMQLNTLDATRPLTVCNGALTSAFPQGFYSGANGKGSGIDGATIINGGIPVSLKTDNVYARNVHFIDPYREVAEIGSGTAHDGIEFTGNTVRTQTSGYISSSAVTIFNATNVKVKNNKIIEEGNTSWATNFINASNASATGQGGDNFGNTSPAGHTAYNVGSSAIVLGLTPPAGTSGGVPYYSSATALSSSAALAANGIVVGGGAGVAPASTPATVDTSGNIAAAAAILTTSAANGFVVGPTGTTNPSFWVNPSTSSAANGLEIIPTAAGSSISLNVVSSNSTESLIIGSKSSGTVNLRTSAANRLQLSDSAVTFTPTTSTGAATTRLSWTGAADNSLTASTEAPEAYINMGQTRTHSTGDISLQRDMRITPSTHGFGGASIIANAAALAIDSGPIGGSSATLTNSSAIYLPTWTATNTTNAYGLNVAAPTGGSANFAAIIGGMTIDGSANLASVGTIGSGVHTITSTSANALTVGANGATNPVLQVNANTASVANGISIQGTAAGSSVTIQTISSNATESLILGAKSAATVNLRTSGANRFQVSDSAATFTPTTSTGASTARFSWTGAADTSLTTTVEAPEVYFNMGQTRTHATGAITLQRDMRITPSTHAAGAGSIITDGAGLAIDSGPLAGANITYTTDSALYMPTWSATGATTGIGVNVAAPTGATTNYAMKTTGKSLINGEISGGTTFTVSGCSATSPVGGATAGQFTSGTTGVCTATVTINGATGMTAPNGWSCWANDETTGNLFRQTGSNTATATFSGTTVTSDVITFGCMGY